MMKSLTPEEATEMNDSVRGRAIIIIQKLGVKNLFLSKFVFDFLLWFPVLCYATDLQLYKLFRNVVFFQFGDLLHAVCCVLLVVQVERKRQKDKEALKLYVIQLFWELLELLPFATAYWIISGGPMEISKDIFEAEQSSSRLLSGWSKIFSFVAK